MAETGKFERTMSFLLVMSAVSVAGTLLWSQFGPRPQPASGDRITEPIYFSGWDREVENGILMGPSDASVVVSEFIDFECPFCRSHAARMDTLRSEDPRDVAIVVHHFPLRNHRFAHISAVAAECSSRQGRFESFYKALFEKQDSIGLKSWMSLAEMAGVPDVQEFEDCRTENQSFDRIEYGRALAERMGISGTPTVLVNGWRLPRPPELEELREMVTQVLNGNVPVTGDTSDIVLAS